MSTVVLSDEDALDVLFSLDELPPRYRSDSVPYPLVPPCIVRSEGLGDGAIFFDDGLMLLNAALFDSLQ